MNQLPEKLITLRRHYHVSQQQVASFCHVDLIEYMSWENGRSVPNELQYSLLAELFHLSLEDMKSDSLDVPLMEVQEEHEEVIIDQVQKDFDAETVKIREIEKTQVVNRISETIQETEEKESLWNVDLLKDWRLWAAVVSLLVIFMSVRMLFKEPENTLDGIEVNNRIIESERLAAGDGFVLMLNANGTVSGSGKNDQGQIDVSMWRDIASITAGNAFSAGLKTNGSVVASGSDRYGQIQTETWTDMIEISAGAEHLVGLSADGTVLCIGDNSEGQCEVSAWTDVVNISASESSTLGLLSDGTIVTAGKIDVDMDDLASWTKIKKLINGQSQVLALTEKGTVYCTTSSSYPVCQGTENWKDVVSVKTAGNHAAALLVNGRLVSSGDDSMNQTQVSEFKNIISIAAGPDFTVTLNRNSQLIGTGNNEYEQFEMQKIEANEPLRQVSGITVLIEEEVHISWDEVSGANYYQIQIPELGYSANVADLSASLALNRFVNESVYTVSIRALTMDHSREPSKEAVVTFTFFAPEVTPEPTPTIVPTPTPTPVQGEIIPVETPEPTQTPDPEPSVEPTQTPETEEPVTTETPEPVETEDSEENNHDEV
ncbi:MAG: hypothetical protein J6K75_04615 [Erysipelotrichaceae bacterium]|nr:hypothetical protein [Erysipelotrichaceae bacterium]